MVPGSGLLKNACARLALPIPLPTRVSREHPAARRRGRNACRRRAGGQHGAADDLALLQVCDHGIGFVQIMCAGGDPPQLVIHGHAHQIAKLGQRSDAAADDPRRLPSDVGDAPRRCSAVEPNEHERARLAQGFAAPFGGLGVPHEVDHAFDRSAAGTLHLRDGIRGGAVDGSTGAGGNCCLALGRIYIHDDRRPGPEQESGAR